MQACTSHIFQSLDVQYTLAAITHLHYDKPFKPCIVQIEIHRNVQNV